MELISLPASLTPDLSKKLRQNGRHSTLAMRKEIKGTKPSNIQMCSVIVILIYNIQFNIELTNGLSPSLGDYIPMILVPWFL